jgi:hypothetical protein
MAKSQIRKFREAARAVETDESEERFNSVLKAVAKGPARANDVTGKKGSPTVAKDSKPTR